MHPKNHMTIADGRLFRLRFGLMPGDLGRITSLHGELYAREYELNHVFEAYVAESLALFAKQYDPHIDRVWIAEIKSELVGTIGIVHQQPGVGQLRWFLVTPNGRGCGVGSLLLDRCLEFCRTAGYQRVFLWTFDGLAVAARLYVRAGFILTRETPATTNWGPKVVEQRYDLLIGEPQTQSITCANY